MAKWLQKALNPKHAGFCSPMSKSTCTPRRKALAMRFKKGDLHKESAQQIAARLLEDDAPKDDDQRCPQCGAKRGKPHSIVCDYDEERDGKKSTKDEATD